MFYLILALMLVLFYIFAAPNSIRGTMNLVLIVFLVVALIVAIILGLLRILQAPAEIWVCFIMTFLGMWAMRDIAMMQRPSHKKRQNTERRYKQY